MFIRLASAKTNGPSGVAMCSIWIWIALASSVAMSASGDMNAEELTFFWSTLYTPRSRVARGATGRGLKSGISRRPHDSPGSLVTLRVFETSRTS